MQRGHRKRGRTAACTPATEVAQPPASAATPMTLRPSQLDPVRQHHLGPPPGGRVGELDAQRDGTGRRARRSATRRTTTCCLPFGSPPAADMKRATAAAVRCHDDSAAEASRSARPSAPHRRTVIDCALRPHRSPGRSALGHQRPLSTSRDGTGGDAPTCSSPRPVMPASVGRSTGRPRPASTCPPRAVAAASTARGCRVSRPSASVAARPSRAAARCRSFPCRNDLGLASARTPARGRVAVPASAARRSESRCHHGDERDAVPAGQLAHRLQPARVAAECK